MTRILFVDDEPIVLRALDRSIRAKRRSWDASFVQSGADALELLAREPFDVIVSDICMPAMDGVTLLASVRAQFPHMARLALSGEARTPDRMRAAHAIHQWLAKPCTLGRLGETIDQLRWGRELVDDVVIVGLVRGLASVPSAPAVCLEVGEALERNAKLHEIVAVIERDPACASKLLQLVNTGFFAEAERVTSVARAASIIGIDRLRELLLASELFRSSVEAEAVTARGLRVASIARALATEDHGEVFLAGHTPRHRIGRPRWAGRAAGGVLPRAARRAPPQHVGPPGRDRPRGRVPRRSRGRAGSCRSPALRGRAGRGARGSLVTRRAGRTPDGRARPAARGLSGSRARDGLITRGQTARSRSPSRAGRPGPARCRAAPRSRARTRRRARASVWWSIGRAGEACRA